jgi:hypothetical protein
MSIERTVLEKLRALPPHPAPAELIPTMVERIVRAFEPVQIILLPCVYCASWKMMPRL